ncbi:phosphatidylserine decarboxylase [Tieghemostelium lacteum]|uniref:Phosphatidylserine decarboxylase proenzyme, mitochondrial n=1 Tax=Tieghemostelium lacteum TaxID=361077 RepID=A0A151Z705_TIELA|nr:phosphatidylserine decarboxylase [Tieghemostelium lacteum]|eukprot:KYQ89718.1 phosphatidylserine decarboxylase [Tieghemostelium lacteum]
MIKKIISPSSFKLVNGLMNGHTSKSWAISPFTTTTSNRLTSTSSLYSTFTLSGSNGQALICHSTKNYIITSQNYINSRSYSTSNEQQQKQQEQQEQKQQNEQQPKKKGSLKSKLLLGSMGLFAGSVIYFKFKYGDDFKAEYLKRIPFRVTSKLWGKFANLELPEYLRSPFYLTYSKLFGVNLDEVEKPIESYKSMGDFFSRRLKEGSRVIDKQAEMVSPVDGTVIYFGKVDKNTMEQVKGLTYSLHDFLGNDLKKEVEDKNLYHIALYLSPGDYHGIHSPVDWKIKNRYHFPGYLLPVAKFAVETVPGLFSINERVVLSGNWKHGFFSLVPVGASNVGSIVMDFDKQLSTNNPKDPYTEKSLYYHRSYDNIIPSSRGSEVAFFKMGSTVVLIFEVPKGKSFDFNLKPAQTVKYGQAIGEIKNN